MRILAGITFSTMLMLFAAADARTISVPAEYTDIQKAVDNAGGGDTVFVSAGIYKETIEMRDSVVLTGEDREKTVIIGVENLPVVRIADNAVISNLTIKGGSVGVLCANKFAIIERCIITDNKQTGIHCLLSLPVIRNNVVCRNKWTGIFCEGVRSLRGGLENNVIAENEYSGLNLAGKTEIMVVNNVFAFNRQYGVFAGAGSKKTTILSNNFYGNRTPINNEAGLIKTNNVFVDPAFESKSPSGWDYLRSKTWPLKGAGRDGRDIGIME